MLSSSSIRVVNNNGSILVYLLVIAGVVGFICAVFASSIVSLQKKIVADYSASALDFKADQIVRHLRLQNGLIDSTGLEKNVDLYVCLRGGEKASCKENCCNAGIPTGFSFVEPTTSGDIKDRRTLTGPPESPVFYYDNGNFCDPGDKSDCDYSLTTVYTAICPGWEASCPHAEHLKIELDIKMIANKKVKILKKDRKYTFIHINDLNYRPLVIAPTNNQFYLGQGTQVELEIRGDSGHPSEKQNFKFTKCESDNNSIFTLLSPADQPFSGGVSTIRLNLLSPGDANLLLEIDDGSVENSRSIEYRVPIRVHPGNPT